MVDKEDADYPFLYDGTTIADFEISRCRTAKELHSLLAQSDALEILFRKISSHMHYKKTGDAQGAQDMLAVKAPACTASWPPIGCSRRSPPEARRNTRPLRGSP